MSASPGTGIADLVVARPAAVDQRLAEPARRRRTRAGGGPRRPRAGAGGRRWRWPAAPAGTGRSAARRARAASRYSTRSRARAPVQLGGHGARRWSPCSAASDARCPARHLVREQQSRARGRTAAAGPAPRPTGPRPPARSSSGGVGRAAGRRRGAGCAGRRSWSCHMRGDEVARGDDRVRLEHPGLDPVRRGQHPGQRLLDQVVLGRPVAHPRAHDPPDERDERGDVRLLPMDRGTVRGLGGRHPRKLRRGAVRR